MIPIGTGGSGAPARTVFLVDDLPENLARFELALVREGYRLRKFADGADAVAAIDDGELPDLIVMDVMMPRMDGLTVCRRLKSGSATAPIPIVLVTGLDQLEDKIRGLEAGADDFLTKPFHPLELRARVRSLMRIKILHDELDQKRRILQDEKLLLETLVHERTEELESITLGLVASLEKAHQLRDKETGLHIRRVCLYSEILGTTLGLDPLYVTRIRRYATLHDVGKVGIPDAILKKEGRLTPTEYEEMKKHSQYGYDLLALAQADETARQIALHHHERFDGTGYPYGLKGAAIPLEARVVALADVYDALTTRRCYKDAFSPAEAEGEIRRSRGSHFDPDVVDAMFKSLGSFNAVREQYGDEPVPVVFPTTEGYLPAPVATLVK